MTRSQKNYIILIAISLFTIIFLWYAVKWHESYKDEYSVQNYIASYITEVKVDEFDNFINDRRDVVVYYAKPADTKAYNFEKKFTNEIIKYSLSEEIIYMNVTSLLPNDFITTINKYNSPTLNNNIDSFPALGIYKDAKLIAFLNGNNLTSQKAVNLMLDYNVIHKFD